MRTHGRSQRIVGAVGIGHPIAQRFVDGGAQGSIAARHRHHGGAQQLHAPDVGRLTLDVHRAHVHHAGHAQPRRGGGARDAVLSGAGFGDDALRAQALGEQRLAHRVVDLVGAGVRQVFALQPHLRAPALAQGRRIRQRRGAAHPGLELAIELGLKLGAVQVAGRCRPAGDRAPAPGSRARSGRRRRRSGLWRRESSLARRLRAAVNS